MLRALRSSSPPEAVLVNSDGGHFEFFSTVAPSIERRGITMISGDVRSSAVALFLLGHRRLAYLDSTFFFHEVRAIVYGHHISVADLEHAVEAQEEMRAEGRGAYRDWLHDMKRAQQWLLDFMSQKSGVPASTFLNLMRSEATLTAHEARRYGIVHEILPETLFDREE
jgi:ATP-dependent protease ClpP protease subunit